MTLGHLGFNLCETLCKGLTNLLHFIGFVASRESGFLRILGQLIKLRTLAFQKFYLGFQTADGLIAGVDQQKLDELRRNNVEIFKARALECQTDVQQIEVGPEDGRGGLLQIPSSKYPDKAQTFW
jgi:hypothetical protein